MGYGYYEIDGMKRGYTVACKCHQRGCKERIDRGLSYLCYSCTWYFCGKHLTIATDSRDDLMNIDCFAGQSSQVCFRCAKELEIDNAGGDEE